MKKIVKPDYSAFDSVYGNDFPLDILFFETNNKVASEYKVYGQYDVLVIDFLVKNGFKIEAKTVSTQERKENSVFFLRNDKANIFIRCFSYRDFDLFKSNSKYYVNITFLYNIDNGEIGDQFDLTTLDAFKSSKRVGGIQLLKSDNGHLDTVEFSIDSPEINIGLNYGEEFLPIHEHIVASLNKNKSKGIVLFHGEPGSGKTTYIRHLINNIKDKDIIFIPPSVAESLSDPNFINFLMEKVNSILVIEDAERVISDRQNLQTSQSAVSNILNLTDGLLSDCLGIQVVATFNMNRDKIDNALLRKGRLIAEHKFGPLSVENSNKLLENLGFDERVNKEMVLTDIYNIKDTVYKTQTTNKIGFK